LLRRTSSSAAVNPAGPAPMMSTVFRESNIGSRRKFQRLIVADTIAAGATSGQRHKQHMRPSAAAGQAAISGGQSVRPADTA
jgi:hypothetical protein